MSGLPIEQRFPRPSVMGIVNVTPDSFSDGGVNFEPEAAIASARRMLAEGAAIVDIGAESTRPGADAVEAGEELRRIEPVLAELLGAPISIDTSKAVVARRALELGAELVNDVTALRADPEMVEVVAESGAYLCLMHMRGKPRTMQDEPRYEDVVSEVAAFLEERLAFATAHGVREERICLDPGFGFGKTPVHNLEVMRHLSELRDLGFPVLLGTSRKSTLGRVLGGVPPEDRLEATLATTALGIAGGVDIIRVHDVLANVRAARMSDAIVRGVFP